MHAGNETEAESSEEGVNGEEERGEDGEKGGEEEVGKDGETEREEEGGKDGESVREEERGEDGELGREGERGKPGEKGREGVAGRHVAVHCHRGLYHGVMGVQKRYGGLCKRPVLQRMLRLLALGRRGFPFRAAIQTVACM